MRSKYRPRGAPLPPPRRSNPWTQVLVGLVLVVVGAALALSVERLVTSAPGPGTKATAAPSALPSLAAIPLASPEASAAASGAAVASTAPAASPSPAAPVLEAEMPRAVNGTALTTESALNATSLGSGSNSRALSAAVTSLGKKPADLEIADAFDPSGALALSILGFRLPGIDPAKLRPVVLDAWLSVKSSGVTSTSVSLSGTPSTKVSYGDGGPDQYVFVFRDSVFVIVTADQALATSAVAAMAAVSPSPSGG